MKIAAIIQARMGSTRLPGKVLMDLSGKTVLARVVERVQRARLIDEVVIATTTSQSDDGIVDQAKQLGVAVVRGSEQDVLDRYWRAGQQCHAGVIVRITSDCPLIDAELIDATIRVFLDQHADYASNSITPTYPRGLDVEVFTAQALELTHKSAQKSYEREHVTPYFYEHPEIFRLASQASPTDYNHHRWTLDTPEDLEFVRTVYKNFPGRDYFGWEQVLELVERNPALTAINAHVRQKQLLET